MAALLHALRPLRRRSRHNADPNRERFDRDRHGMCLDLGDEGIHPHVRLHLSGGSSAE